MQPHINLWIEKDDKVVLSTWRVHLLETIDETGSISAAHKLEISYRRAWDKVHEMEDGLGIKLVQTQTGGVGGGGAQLTADGRKFVEKFYRFQAGFEDQVKRRFEETFGETQL